MTHAKLHNTDRAAQKIPSPFFASICKGFYASFPVTETHPLLHIRNQDRKETMVTFHTLEEM